VYGQAQHASELILRNATTINRQTRGTSLRLETLAGGHAGLTPPERILEFVLRAREGKDIQIHGGQQRIARLDVRDAADAILALLDTDAHTLEAVYNVGTGKAYTIVSIADMTLDIARQYHCVGTSKVVVEPCEVKTNRGMDCSRFSRTTGWTAQHDMHDIIHSLFRCCEVEPAGSQEGASIPSH